MYMKEVCFKESAACVVWDWQLERGGRAGLQPGNRQELGLQSQGRTPQGNLRFCSQGSRLVRWFIQVFFT